MSFLLGTADNRRKIGPFHVQQDRRSYALRAETKRDSQTRVFYGDRGLDPSGLTVRVEAQEGTNAATAAWIGNVLREAQRATHIVTPRGGRLVDGLLDHRATFDGPRIILELVFAPLRGEYLPHRHRLMGEYWFDEGNTTRQGLDHSGSRNHLVEGYPRSSNIGHLFQPSQYPDDYVATKPFESGDFITIHVAFMVSDITVNGFILNKFGNGGDTPGLGVRYHNASGNRTLFLEVNIEGDTVAKSFLSGIEENDWTEVCIVVGEGFDEDEFSFKIYHQGVLVNERFETLPFGMANPYELRFGRAVNRDSFHGQIGYAMFYDRALSAAEVADNYEFIKTAFDPRSTHDPL